MATVVAEARRFTELLGARASGTPYLFDRIFSTEGLLAKWLSRRKFKLLKVIDGEVRAILDEGETVHFITWGVRSGLIEAYILGWALAYFNRMAFVFTTRRILLVQVSVRNKPLKLRSQIPYTAVRTVSRTFLGSLKLRYRDGGKTVFQGMPRRDSKHVRDLVSRLVQRAEDEGLSPSDGARGLQHLCPHCYEPVEGRPRSCPHCGGGFKSANMAGLLSLLFPGIGDFYMGHRKIALMEIGVAALIWVAFFLPDPEFEMTWMAKAIGAAIIFVLIHVPDAIATRYLATKGVFPSA